jgi:uncharacterized protein
VRVLVTGGTGFIGTKLVAALGRRGDEVVVLSRKPEGKGHVGWGALPAEVERADAVVHLAGANVAETRWTRERLALLRSSRVETTAALARAIAAAAKRPGVLVSGSAVGYYGMREDDAVLDESAPAGEDVLAQLVVAWEAAAAAARDAGVRVAHPRTGIVLGPEGGALAKMLGPFRAFVGGPIGSGAQWVSWVDVRDAVGAILFALDTSTLVGPFNLTAPEPVRMRDLARALGKALGRPSALKVPAFALKLALGEGLARALTTGQRAIPSALIRAGYAFQFPSIDDSLRSLLAASS